MGAGGKDETNETHTQEAEAQTNDPNQTPEKDASWNKWVALASFLSDLGSRAAFIVPALLNGGTASFGLYLYTIDLMLFAYYAYQDRYCPGCLYNNLRVLIKGKKLKPCFIPPIETKRFSAKEKFIVGIGSFATIFNVVEGVSGFWCAWDEGGGNIHMENRETWESMQKTELEKKNLLNKFSNSNQQIFLFKFRPFKHALHFFQKNCQQLESETYC